MGEAQTPHFYDFGIFEPVTKPQNQHYLSLETPRHLNEIKKIPGPFSNNMIFANGKLLETHNSDIFGKGGHRTMMKIRRIKFQKAWICISYLPKTCNGNDVICAKYLLKT